MGEMIDLGEVRRAEFLRRPDLKEIPLAAQVVEFLGTYGMSFVDMDIISKGIFRGKRTVEELAVFYLNWMLTRRLGPEFFLEGNIKEIAKKFKGLHFFKNKGPGPLRWAVYKINSLKYGNFEDVYKILYRENFPAEGLMNFLDKKRNKKFIIDLTQDFFKEKSLTIGKCWTWHEGCEFFCCAKEDINNGQVFIPDKGQDFKDVFAEAEKEFEKIKFS